MSPSEHTEALGDVKDQMLSLKVIMNPEAYISGDLPLARLQSIIYGQACVLFPNRTPASAFMKLFEEMGEVIKDPTNPMEWADVFILMLDLARMHGVTDLTGAVLTKARVNQAREWEETTTGTWQHKTKEGEE